MIRILQTIPRHAPRNTRNIISIYDLQERFEEKSTETPPSNQFHTNNAMRESLIPCDFCTCDVIQNCSYNNKEDAPTED